jgi:hypothetical protein
VTAGRQPHLEPDAVMQVRPFMFDEELRAGGDCDDPGPDCIYWLNCMTAAGYVAWPAEFQAALQASFLWIRQQMARMVDQDAVGDAIGWAEFARTYRLLSKQLSAEAASLEAWIEGVTYDTPRATHEQSPSPLCAEVDQGQSPTISLAGRAL